MTTVLVVDDERRIAQIARDYLEHAGFAVITASEGRDALARARADHPDLVVLDLGLPTIDGLDVAKTLRRESDVPIIMLTARVDESDRLIGLAVGADDYITKPFSPKELVARVQAILRRTRGEEVSGPTKIGPFQFDRERHRVLLHQRELNLTPTEYRLLEHLLQRPGRVFSRARLLEAEGRRELGLLRLAAPVAAIARGDIKVVDAWCDAVGASLDRRVTVIDPTGRVLGDSRVPLDSIPMMENHAGRPEVRAAL